MHGNFSVIYILQPLSVILWSLSGKRSSSFEFFKNIIMIKVNRKFNKIFIAWLPKRYNEYKRVTLTILQYNSILALSWL